jgi:hypothetical protein
MARLFALRVISSLCPYRRFRCCRFHMVASDLNASVPRQCPSWRAREKKCCPQCTLSIEYPSRLEYRGAARPVLEPDGPATRHVRSDWRELCFTKETHGEATPMQASSATKTPRTPTSTSSCRILIASRCSAISRNTQRLCGLPRAPQPLQDGVRESQHVSEPDRAGAQKRRKHWS